MIDAGCRPTQTSLVNYGVTEPKFTKLSHFVARSWLLLMHQSTLQYSNTFWNAKAMNEAESDDFADFDPKIGCHGNVPLAIGKKEGLINNL